MHINSTCIFALLHIFFFPMGHNYLSLYEGMRTFRRFTLLKCRFIARKQSTNVSRMTDLSFSGVCVRTCALNTTTHRVRVSRSAASTGADSSACIPARPPGASKTGNAQTRRCVRGTWEWGRRSGLQYWGKGDQVGRPVSVPVGECVIQSLYLTPSSFLSCQFVCWGWGRMLETLNLEIYI